MTLEVFPGLLWDDGDGLGTYFAKDGTKHHCSRAHSSDLARRGGLIVAFRNRYEYHAPGKNSSMTRTVHLGKASHDMRDIGKMSACSYGPLFEEALGC